MIDSDKKQVYTHLVVLGSLAFLLRLLYFSLALDNMGIEDYFTSIPDSKTYWQVAQNFSESSYWGNYWLFQVGPGYGLILFVLDKISFGGYYLFYIFNILMGASATVLIYLIAYELFKSKTISFMAGFFNAVSLTGITLSCNILTDQPGFTFLALSLWMFLAGLRRNQLSWFLASGLIGGWAAYVRGTMTLWGVILLAFILLLLLTKVYKGKKNLFKKAITAPIIIILMVQCWSFYNYVNNDVYTFGGNGIRSLRLRLGALAIVNNSKITYHDLMEQWALEDSVRFDGKITTSADIYYNDIRQIKKIYAEHPDWILSTYLDNIHGNLIEGNFIPRNQIPGLMNLWNTTIVITGKWFGYVLFYLTLVGLVVIGWKRQILSLMVLGVIYLYFTLITGFSMWQGSRLHYTAELGWDIVLAALFYYSFLYIKNKITKSLK